MRAPTLADLVRFTSSSPVTARLLAVAVAIPAAVACSTPGAAQDDDAGSTREARFAEHWRDGRAEINGYELQLRRYGEVRRGQAVLIYVTEPFSESRRVKLDSAPPSDPDRVEALKLNLVRDFQTGIYDYNTMVSTFVRTSDMSPLKTSFTSAEWCGHVYEELLFDSGTLTGRVASYFEGESGWLRTRVPEGGISEDNLPILLRGLDGPFLEPGAERQVPLLVSALVRRLEHRPLEWVEARISRAGEPEQVQVPAGSFLADVYTVEIAGSRRGVFHVEHEYPHRIVRWSLAPDVEARLTGSRRLAYWRLNQASGEAALEPLGISPVVP